VIRFGRREWADFNAKRKNATPAAKQPNPHAPYANAWEREYAGILAMELAAGKWASALYEAATYTVIPATARQRKVSYTPDFQLIDPQGRLSFIEVKGHLRTKDQIRMKAFRALMPTVPLFIVRKVKGHWESTEF
jgi:hypothetical protein